MRKSKKNIIAIVIASVFIISNALPVMAQTKAPNSPKGSYYSWLENKNSNAYLDYVSTLSFTGKQIDFETIPISKASDGSDTTGIIVNIGDEIMTSDENTTGTDVFINNNNRQEDGWAYSYDRMINKYIVGISTNSLFTLDDTELATSTDLYYCNRAENAATCVSEHQIITNNGQITKWKAFRVKYSDIDDYYVQLVPAS